MKNRAFKIMRGDRGGYNIIEAEASPLRTKLEQHDSRREGKIGNIQKTIGKVSRRERERKRRGVINEMNTGRQPLLLHLPLLTSVLMSCTKSQPSTLGIGPSRRNVQRTRCGLLAELWQQTDARQFLADVWPVCF